MTNRTTMLLAVAGLLSLASARAPGQVLHTVVDILSPGDAGHDGIPPNVLVIDVFVDVAATDTWVAAGIIAQTENGATLRYHDSDPNRPGQQPGLFNPGIENRFVTSLSQPRGRNLPARFTNAGASAAGNYDPPGPTAVTMPTELNIAYFASPPASSGSPSVDGYVARFALDISATGHAVDEFTIALTEPNDSIYFACAPMKPQYSPGGFDNATYDVPRVDSFDFWITIPEPASMALLLIGLGALGRIVRGPHTEPTP